MSDDLPEGCSVEITKMQVPGFFRCIIRDDMGRPIGIGEGPDEMIAKTLAMKSWRKT